MFKGPGPGFAAEYGFQIGCHIPEMGGPFKLLLRCGRGHLFFQIFQQRCNIPFQNLDRCFQPGAVALLRNLAGTGGAAIFQEAFHAVFPGIFIRFRVPASAEAEPGKQIGHGGF